MVAPRLQDTKHSSTFGNAIPSGIAFRFPATSYFSKVIRLVSVCGPATTCEK